MTTLRINGAPVLTLWAAVVAERLGSPWETALTVGQAVRRHDRAREVHAVLFDPFGEDNDAEREFLDRLTGNSDVQAGELVEAKIARAGRR